MLEEQAIDYRSRWRDYSIREKVYQIHKTLGFSPNILDLLNWVVDEQKRVNEIEDGNILQDASLEFGIECYLDDVYFDAWQKVQNEKEIKDV